MQGDPESIRLLRPPCECPEPLEYLHEWSQELAAARTYHPEHGPDGTMITVPDALTYTMVDAWARLRGREPTPIEVETLFRLDVISRFPDATASDEDADE